MSISVLARVCNYRGDHSEEVAVAFDVKPDETVEQLVVRIHDSFSNNYDIVDCIELRKIRS